MLEYGLSLNATSLGGNRLTESTVQLSNGSIHYLTSGEGEPVVLLHGWPQTSFCWRKVMQLLPPGLRVIAPDLPGLGASTNLRSTFDKKSLARDIVEFCESLGLSSYHLVGHDWGGGVAWAMASHFPGAIKTLTLVDIAIPGDGNPNISQNGARWHHAFHQTLDLPEALIAGREELYLSWFYRNYGHRPDALSVEEQAHYLHAYRSPDKLKNGFALYRAFHQDCEDNLARAQHYRPNIPVLAIGGGSSWGRGTQVADSARRMADDVREAVIPDAGHWIPEEKPEALIELLLGLWAR
jgi:pimeloyl-ACP methyl ester carboxylesterase